MIRQYLNKKLIIGFILLSLLLAMLPALRLLPSVGKQAFFKTYATNYSSYLVRIHEIKDGHPFIGNSYFIEHNSELAQSFFIPDWITAGLYVIGVPFDLALFLNLVIWLFMFFLLTYLVLRSAGVSPRISIGATVVSLATSYLLLIIPVSMQVVTPCFAFFLIALLLWIQDPLNDRRSFLLAIASAVSFYVYTYLWQITFTALVVTALALLLERQWPAVKRMCLIFGATLLVSLPQIVYTIKQLRHPDYWDTIQRIGFVATHLPTSRAIIYALWALAIGLFGYLLSRKDRNKNKPALIFVATTGIALFIASLSNVITGKELELGQHIPRFIVYWAPIALAILLISISNVKKYWAATILLALPLFPIIDHDYKSFFVGDSAKGAVQEIEYRNKLAGVIDWLENNEPEPIVVAVIPRKAQVEEAIPTFTKHYVMYASTGIVYLLSTQETLERYLITQILAPKTKQELWDYREEFSGIGNTTHFRTVTVRREKFCKLVSKINLDKKFDICVHPIQHPLTPEFFDKAYELEQRIVANPEPYLKKYHVKYLLLNTSLSPLPKVLSSLNLKSVYSDANFTLQLVEYKK